MAFYQSLHAPPLASSARRAASLVVLLVWGSIALGQEQAPPLRLEGVRPGGARMSATESWGIFDLSLINRSESDRQARAFVLYDEHEDMQYGRELWAPARSVLNSWMLVGPAPAEGKSGTREIQNLLYDRSTGTDHLVLPEGEDRVRSRGIIYRHRDATSVVLVDDSFIATPPIKLLPEGDSPTEEAIRLVRCFRSVHRLSELVLQLEQGPLPPIAQAFDGVDHVVIASDRLSGDMAGMRALRHWLEQGGKMWVMLDRVDPEKLAPLLGPAVDFQVADRVSLTHFHVDTLSAGRAAAAPEQQHEEAVAFTRVVLPPHEEPRHAIGGWPVWFTRSLGRGTIVFTTLGPRGFYRPRTTRDPPSPYPFFTDLPAPHPHLEMVSFELHSKSAESSFHGKAVERMLIEAIGYSVPGRTTVGLILGGFLLGTLILGLALRWAGRAEWLGWLVPLAAVGAAALFLVLGRSSRQSVAPTMAVAQVVDPIAHQKEAAVHGMLALYHPDSGPVEAGAEKGGFFQLDLAGSEGQNRRLMTADMDAWHWENVSLPAGVRLASFHTSVSLQEPLAAIGRFGADGLEGRLAGPFVGAGDAVVTNPGGRTLAVQMQPEGRFRATAQDILPRGQFLAPAVLSDRQQRRQEIYRAFLKDPSAEHLHQRPVLLTWGEPLDMGFHLGAASRTIGSALFVVPLSLERSPARDRVTIPAPFVSYRRILNGVPGRPKLEATEDADMHLRFQLPPEVLPFTVEQARLSTRIEAPGRRVTIAGREGDNQVELRQLSNPLDPIHVDITEPRFLGLDAEGGLHLNLNVGSAPAGKAARGPASPESNKWTIEYLELEVMGRCLAEQ